MKSYSIQKKIMTKWISTTLQLSNVFLKINVIDFYMDGHIN